MNYFDLTIACNLIRFSAVFWVWNMSDKRNSAYAVLVFLSTRIIYVLLGCIFWSKYIKIQVHQGLVRAEKVIERLLWSPYIYMWPGPEGPDGHNSTPQHQDSLQCHPFIPKKRDICQIWKSWILPRKVHKCFIIANMAHFQSQNWSIFSLS